MIGFIASAMERILPAFWGLLLLSVVVGAVLAIIYGRLVNQEKVAQVKTRIHAFISEAVLYRHDPVLTLKAQGALILSGFRYLSTSLIPLAILFIPSMLAFAALQTYYGYYSISENKEAELTITVADSVSPFDVSVSAKPESSISPPLRIPSAHQVVYRISQPAPVALTVGGNGMASEFDLSSLLSARAPEALSTFWLESLFFGSAKELPRGIESVFVSKPVRIYSLGGIDLPWYVWSVAFIFVGGFGAARAFKITF